MGIANIATFDFFTQPDEANLVKSLEIARSLGIIDDMCRLTDVGKKINEFPIDPRLAVSLLKADGETFGCVAEMLTVAAMISNEPIFLNNKDGKLMVKLKKKIGAKEGDHLTLVNVYKFYRNQQSKHNQRRFINEFKINEKSLLNAILLRENLEKIMKKMGYDTAKSDQDTENVLRCISTGFFTNAAQRTPDGSYMILGSKENVIMHPTSILNAIHPNG
jgi:HrpA-like RNA helicase